MYLRSKRTYRSCPGTGWGFLFVGFGGLAVGLYDFCEVEGGVDLGDGGGYVAALRPAGCHFCLGFVKNLFGLFLMEVLLSLGHLFVSMYLSV